MVMQRTPSTIDASAETQVVRRDNTPQNVERAPMSKKSQNDKAAKAYEKKNLATPLKKIHKVAGQRYKKHEQEETQKNRSSLLFEGIIPLN